MGRGVFVIHPRTEEVLRWHGLTTWLYETVDIFMTRWRCLAGLLNLGLNVLLTDTDVVFLSDPFPHFWMDADMEVMTDHLFPERDLWDPRWRDEEIPPEASAWAARRISARPGRPVGDGADASGDGVVGRWGLDPKVAR
eukprot:g14156.t1